MNTTPPPEPHGEPQPPPEHPDGAYGGAPGEQPDPPVHVRPLPGGAGTAYAHAARGGRTGDFGGGPADTQERAAPAPWYVAAVPLDDPSAPSSAGADGPAGQESAVSGARREGSAGGPGAGWTPFDAGAASNGGRAFSGPSAAGPTCHSDTGRAAASAARYEAVADGSAAGPAEGASGLSAAGPAVDGGRAGGLSGPSSAGGDSRSDARPASDGSARPGLPGGECKGSGGTAGGTDRDAAAEPREVFVAAGGTTAADLLEETAAGQDGGPAPGGPDGAPHAPAVSDASRLAGAPPDSTPGEQTGGSARRNPLIASETTTEIPVHLLFRDDDAGSIPLPPAVVNPRPLTGEFPKVQLPKARPTAPEPLTPRAAPPLDPKLTERPGPALPGWIGVVAGSAAAAGIGAVLWGAGVLPGWLTRLLGLPSYTYTGIGFGVWCLLALGVLLTLFGLGGLGRGRVGYAMVLTLFGEYRGSVRRTGLLWVSPLLLRRRVDVRLRHWRSEPMPVVDADGTALRAVVLVVWRVKDTVRAALGVEDHERFLREHVESAMARVLSQLPADVFHQLHQDAPTLRNAEAVGDSLTRLLQAECRPIGIEVFSAQPTRIDYAPEVAAAMQRRRIAAIDAKHRDSVLTSVVDAVDDTVSRLTSRGLVELDDYERKALVKDLTVAFYTGRSQRPEG